MRFLLQAIELSEKSLKNGRLGPFGAIIVHNGEVVGQGWNQVVANHDPTAHAEIVAIRDACRRMATHSLEGCTLYTSCEPCPMCLAAAYWARLERIVFAATRQDAAAAGFDDLFIYQELCQKPEERKLLMEQEMRNEAQIVLRRWAAMPASVAY
ncbi:nucleoside deaminase [Geoalkalibacter halelectricus]|uniref:nucleoside deaminase n=1 Tax=Geoalkalibacter halelectricus TaxID=2847045 RepID=UPI00345F69C5